MSKYTLSISRVKRPISRIWKWHFKLWNLTVLRFKRSISILKKPILRLNDQLQDLKFSFQLYISKYIESDTHQRVILKTELYF